MLFMVEKLLFRVTVPVSNRKSWLVTWCLMQIVLVVWQRKKIRRSKNGGCFKWFWGGWNRLTWNPEEVGCLRQKIPKPKGVISKRLVMVSCWKQSFKEAGDFIAFVYSAAHFFRVVDQSSLILISFFFSGRWVRRAAENMPGILWKGKCIIC